MISVLLSLNSHSVVRGRGRGLIDSEKSLYQAVIFHKNLGNGENSSDDRVKSNVSNIDLVNERGNQYQDCHNK